MSEKAITLSQHTPDNKGIDYSEITPLLDQFSGHSFCALRRIKKIREDIFKIYYSVIILSVGHVDFHGFSSPQSPAITTGMKCCSNSVDEFTSPWLPSQIRASITSMEGDLNGLEVKKMYRDTGQRFGSLLWAIGCLFVFQETAQPIFITDSTDRTVRKDSFYTRWGAKKVVSGHKIASELSPEQIVLLLSAGIDVDPI